MTEIGIETDKIALIFTDLFDTQSVDRPEYVLFVLKTFEIVIDGFKY